MLGRTFNLNHLIVNDVALSASNTATVGNNTFFLQPVSIKMPPTELQHRIETDPEYGKHKKPPHKSDWNAWNKRRMKGEHRLLKYFDCEDRLLWFEHKAMCIQYGGRNDCGYPNRVLMVCERGLFEFAHKLGNMLCKRNMWIDYDQDREIWSHEDVCLTMLFQFQMNPKNFTDYVGCRSSVNRADYPEVRRIYRYAKEMRERRLAYRKFSSQGVMSSTFMLNRKRMEVNQYSPTPNPYCVV